MLGGSLSLKAVAEFMSGRGTAIILIVAIFCGSTLGISLPEAGDFLSDQIDYTILILVFCLLFEVRIQNFLSSLNRLSFIIAALIANFVIIPAVGFAIASLFLSAHPLFFIGLLIYFMAPCTDWFLGFTRLANGNTALGAALLPINMIVQLLLYPIYLTIFGIDTISAGSHDIFQTLWQWFLVPLLLALAIRFLLERTISEKQLEFIHSIISISIPVLLATLVGQIFAANIGMLASHMTLIPLVLCAIFLFFTLTYLLSEVLSKIMKLSHEDHVLMTMTTGARNAPLMLAVTVAVLPEQPVIYAAIIIGTLIEFPHLIALKLLLKRKHEQAKRRTSIPSANVLAKRN